MNIAVVSIWRVCRRLLQVRASARDRYPQTALSQVRCQRCGEIIEGRLNLNNDLSIQYEDGTSYIGRKVLMGNGLCFQQIEANFKFSGEKELLEKSISGGEFIEED